MQAAPETQYVNGFYERVVMPSSSIPIIRAYPRDAYEAGGRVPSRPVPQGIDIAYENAVRARTKERNRRNPDWRRDTEVRLLGGTDFAAAMVAPASVTHHPSEHRL